jgi:hypothetical protein
MSQKEKGFAPILVPLALGIAAALAAGCGGSKEKGTGVALSPFVPPETGTPQATRTITALPTETATAILITEESPTVQPNIKAEETATVLGNETPATPPQSPDNAVTGTETVTSGEPPAQESGPADGPDEKPVETVTPEPTVPDEGEQTPPEEEPTPTLEVTPFVPKSIFEAPFTPTTIDEVRTAINSFYGSHPEAYDWKVDGAPFPQSFVEGNLDTCEHGNPRDAGSPNIILAERAGTCAKLIEVFDWFYAHEPQAAQERETLYELAALVRNYYKTQYPEDDRFDGLLRGLGVD